MDAFRDSMQHGGPDDAGTYHDAEQPVSMGLRRLALIDLHESSHQPMVSQCGQVVITFNGEIYNFIPLRTQLKNLGHTFRSTGDTEVVLNAYLQWGTQCFEKLNGMFAIAIWDKREGTLVLARDHAGMKPLYYHFDKWQQCLYASSETRAFKILQPDWPVNPDWRVHFLAHGHMPEPHTTLKNVWMLPKGHYMEIRMADMHMQLHKWYAPGWKLLYTSETEARHAFRETLIKAVQTHRIADAPLGVFLSGGTDSSILSLIAAANKEQPLTTLSISFEDAAFSEEIYQRSVAKIAGSLHHQHTISERDFEESLPDILLALDQPSNDGINSYFISKFARQAGLKAVISGIGADELFGGYPIFRRRQWVAPLRLLGPLLDISALLPYDRIKRLGYARYPSETAEYLFHRGYFNVFQIAEMNGISPRRVREILQLSSKEQPGKKRNEDGMSHISRLEQDFYLQHQLLRDTDVMSMWHGVEVRMPFLDRDVLDVVNQMAPAIRFANHPPKQFLIESFSHLLPESIWKRRKMGFVFPFEKWMQKATIAGACKPNLFQFQRQFRQGKIRWSRYWAYLVSTRQKIITTKPEQSILFATLKTFSSTGGIEKFNSCFSMALHKNALQHNWQVTLLAAYDDEPDTRYFPRYGFFGFRQKRFRFLLFALRNSKHYQSLCVGHINLGLLALLSKLFNPKMQVSLIAHGIEVWEPLHGIRKMSLRFFDRFICVSRFTQSKLVEVQKVRKTKTVIFPNTIDPYFKKPGKSESVPDYLQKMLDARQPFVLTISRLASTERYKGYDMVLRGLPGVIARVPGVKYILGGTGDPQEQQRIRQLIADLGLQDTVIMPGFIPENQLKPLYSSAHVFAMPSKKEGFGIVFLEAAWCGTPIIAGNADGSVDALLNGQLGTLVDPDDAGVIADTLVHYLSMPAPSVEEKMAKQQIVKGYFGFEAFSLRQQQLFEQGRFIE